MRTCRCSPLLRSTSWCLRRGPPTRRVGHGGEETEEIEGAPMMWGSKPSRGRRPRRGRLAMVGWRHGHGHQTTLALDSALARARTATQAHPRHGRVGCHQRRVCKKTPIRHQALIKHGADEDIKMSALLSLLLHFTDSILISTPWCVRSVLIFFESELDS